MASISSTLDRIKQDLRPFLPDSSIESAARQAGHRWRERKMGPVETVHLFVLQGLCFNTAMTHLRRLSKAAVKASGYCKARMRLPLKVLEALLEQSSRSMQKACSSADGLWCGLRPYLVDGSSTIAPDTPDSQKVFGQPKGCKKGCGFPVPKVLGLFRIHQRTIVSFHPHRKHQVHGTRRPKARGKPMPRSRFIKRLGKHDQIVEWFKSATTKPKWMDQEQYRLLPDSLQVRELRFWIAAKGQRTRVVTIATTLLDPLLYPKEKIAELYGVRWQVETHFAELKTTLKMRRVKSKTSQGVLKELTVYALIYNLIHCVMCRAAAAQGVAPHRVSFIDAVRWLLSADPDEALPGLIVNPDRPDRHEPRAIKDRQDTYTKMSRPRKQMRKELRRQKVEA